MTKQIETLDSERQKLLAEKVVMNDEKKSLSKMLERSQNLQDQLSAQIEAMTQQVGVPKSEVDKLKELLTKREAEVVKMNLELQAVKNKMQDEQNDAFSQIQKITTELTQTRTYLQTKEEEVVMLRRDVSAFQQMEEQLKGKLVGEEVAIANKELEAQTAALKKELETAKDQNKTMILQRKSLVQTKEQIQKELEKLLTKTENLELEKKTIQKDKIEEIQRLKEGAEVIAQGLRDENQRLQDLQEKLESEKDLIDEELNDMKNKLELRNKEFAKLEETF